MDKAVFGVRRVEVIAGGIEVGRTRARLVNDEGVSAGGESARFDSDQYACGNLPKRYGSYGIAGR